MGRKNYVFSLIKLNFIVLLNYIGDYGKVQLSRGRKQYLETIQFRKRSEETSNFPKTFFFLKRDIKTIYSIIAKDWKVKLESNFRILHK